MAPKRDHAQRQQKFNQIGDVGRITGVVPPRNVPRDSAGNEMPSQYFKNSHSHSHQQQQQQPQQQQRQRQQHESPNAANNRARDRPDKFTQLGERGRKTGVQVAPAIRDANGFEPVSHFFQSSPRSAHPTPAQHRTGGAARQGAGSTKKPLANGAFASRQAGSGSASPKGPKANGSPAGGRKRGDDYEQGGLSDGKRRRTSGPEVEEQRWDDDPGPMDFGGGGSDDNFAGGRQYGSDEEDMEVDGGTSLTPSTFVRNAAGSHSNGHSSLRRVSTLPSLSVKAQGKRRRISPPPSDEDPVVPNGQYEDDGEDDDDVEDEEDDEDEVVPVKVAKQRGAGGLRVASAVKPKKLIAPREDDDEDDEGGREYDEREEASHTGRPKAKLPSKHASASPRNNNKGSPRRTSDGTSRATAGNRNNRIVVEEKEEEQEEEEGDEENGLEEQFEYDDGGLDVVAEEDEEDETPRPKGPKASPKRVTAAEKGKGKEVVPKPRKPPVANSAKANAARKRPRDDEPEPDGVRRSGRQKIEPLEYWRNERVIYKRRQSGLGINAVVRFPRVSPDPLTKAGGKKGAKRRGTSARVKSELPGEDEEGVDDMTEPDGLVWNWEGNCETRRRIAFTAKMMNPTPTAKDDFSFQKIFTELDYLAGGILQIRSGQQKPMKRAMDNSYLFFVIEGAVSVTTYRTQHSMGTGGTFFIPRGNSYEITAISSRDAKLFFAQGRRVLEDSEGNTNPDRAGTSSREAEGDDEEEDEEGDEEDEDEEGEYGDEEGEGEDEG